jgi:hypothetical protein
MSGLEVAGVVIGALPLVISALEHYAKGVNTAKRYWRFKTELRSLILQISTERGIFVNTLEQLLTGIVRTEHMAELISDSQSDTWRTSDVDKKLRDRLRDAYDVYLDNMKGMEVALKMIGEKLALDPNGKVSSPVLWQRNLFCAPQEHCLQCNVCYSSKYTAQSYATWLPRFEEARNTDLYSRNFPIQVYSNKSSSDSNSASVKPNILISCKS